MAGTIKGIIVEIGGDTSGLQKALKNVNSATSSLSKELRGVNSLLKLDPSNIQMLNQKQELLTKSIEETENKLKLLHSTYNRAVEAEADGTKISQENWRNLEREIVKTENQLKQFQLQASDWTKAGIKIEEFGKKVTNISGKIDNLGNTLTTRLTLPVLAIGTAAITSGNDFEAQMSRVQAIAGATEDELKSLTDQAIQLGADTSFSASEAAAGMENLASAGFTTSEIMDAMPGLLDLAASSGAELATASEIAASAIRGFGLEASQSGHVADVFAEASARTNAQVEDMGEAMKYIAPVANTMGLKIEEVSAAIGIMSDAGIKGSQAGTSLRGALTRLTKPTDKMVDVMNDLGISFYDNEGKMKSLKDMIAMLEKATKGLTDEEEQYALTTLFGTESLSGMLSLIDRGPDELEDMTKSFENCDGAAEDMANTMLDNAKGALESLSGSLESAGIAIQQALSPKIKDLAKWIQGLVDDFNNLSEEEKQNIVQTGLLVAAIGPAISILGKLGNGIGSTIKALGTFSQAIGVFKTGAKSANESANKLASGFSLITNPATIAATVITTSIGIIISQIKKAEEETKNSLTNIGEGATDFVTGINTAESHLESFNSTLFASSSEQQKLKEEMQDIQDGITQICKTASEERRDYTQEEIVQLEEYFTKLRDLKNQEIAIQSSIATAITQQATTTAQSFQGSLEEYKVQSQEWINTAVQQRDATIKIIQDGTTQEIALLNQKYGNQATMQNEAYAKEYNNIIAQQEEKINAANQEVFNVSQIYEKGYKERASQNDGFYVKLQEYNKKLEDETNRHNGNIESIENNALLTQYNKNAAKANEEYRYKENMKKIWKEMYKNMSEEQEDELGVWLGMVAQTELYGGKIDDETSEMVDNIIKSYDSMPKETQEAMKNAMNPMLDEMEKKEPSLFAKASSIANGIVSRLKSAFQEHSPSKLTRKIMRYAMEPMEEEMEKGKDILFKQTSEIGKGINKRLNKIDLAKNINKEAREFTLPNFNEISGKIKQQSRTIFTTPQIVFNVQELDEARLQQCFNYINKKFGSQY